LTHQIERYLTRPDAPIWCSRARQTTYVAAGREEQPMRDPDHIPHQLRLALTPTEAAQELGRSRDFFDKHIGPELRWFGVVG
jgi:hypothetical protein